MRSVPTSANSYFWILSNNHHVPSSTRSLFFFLKAFLVYETLMKLTLRPEWRLRPLSSFLGIADLKAGVTIAILFAVRLSRFSVVSSPFTMVF